MIFYLLIGIAGSATLNKNALHDNIAACFVLERMRGGISNMEEMKQAAKEDTEKLSAKTFDVFKFGLIDTARLERVVEVVEKLVNLVGLWLWQASTEEGSHFEDFENGFVEELSLLVSDLGADEEAELKRLKGQDFCVLFSVVYPLSL